jgi:hypothetical protein
MHCEWLQRSSISRCIQAKDPCVVGFRGRLHTPSRLKSHSANTTTVYITPRAERSDRDGESRFSVLLSAHHFYPNEALIPLNPSVVTGWYRVRVTCDNVLLGSVHQTDGQSARNGIPDMGKLVYVSLDNRLDAFGLPPSWVEGETAKCETLQANDLDA